MTAPNEQPEAFLTEEERNEELEVSKKLSDRLKSEGNEYFKNGKYAQAILKYTDAIDEYETFALYSNRANAYIKTEAYGLAIMDAKEAIRLDPKNPKGSYRLGTAYFLLSKFKLAKDAFLAAYKLKPLKMFKEQYEKSRSEMKRVAFEKAIRFEPKKLVVKTFNVAQVSIPDDYDGPKLKREQLKAPLSPSKSEDHEFAFKNGENVDNYKVEPEMVERSIQWMFEQQLLPKKIVFIILIKIYKLLSELPTLINVDFGEEVTFNVCGDTHGQFYDLKNIFETNGKPSPTNWYLFNGDFVDRGSFSVEVILTLFLWKLAYPSYVHLLRGNHETRNMNRMYGFDGEVKHKYNDTVLDMFIEVFRQLPLVAVLNKKVIVMHGGLPIRDGVKLDDLKKIDRNKEPGESGLMSDLLWSDPQPFDGRAPSKRGVGKSFGPDITKAFLEDNGLELIIRSHEVREEGYLVEHDGKLITVFSAPNYCDTMGNKGAVVKLKSDMKPDFFVFEAVSHPPVKPMAYAANMSMFA